MGFHVFNVHFVFILYLTVTLLLGPLCFLPCIVFFIIYLMFNLAAWAVNVFVMHCAIIFYTCIPDVLHGCLGRHVYFVLLCFASCQLLGLLWGRKDCSVFPGGTFYP